jgi:hypothetical protein
VYSTNSTTRLLGAAFLLQAAAAVVWTVLHDTLIATDDIVASMTNIADNVLQMRASIVVTMITAMAIVFLGSMLYLVLRTQNGKIALVAFGLYLLEVAILAVSRIPVFSLIQISQESVIAGHPDYLQTLGNLAYEAAAFGDWLHMLPFAVGALLFYTLFFQSRYIPRALALFGLVAASLGLIGTLLVLLGYDVPIIVVALNFPFEVTAGVWLIVKGINYSSETA